MQHYRAYSVAVSYRRFPPPVRLVKFLFTLKQYKYNFRPGSTYLPCVPLKNQKLKCIYCTSGSKDPSLGCPSCMAYSFSMLVRRFRSISGVSGRCACLSRSVRMSSTVGYTNRAALLGVAKRDAKGSSVSQPIFCPWPSAAATVNSAVPDDVLGALPSLLVATLRTVFFATSLEASNLLNSFTAAFSDSFTPVACLRRDDFLPRSAEMRVVALAASVSGNAVEAVTGAISTAVSGVFGVNSTSVGALPMLAKMATLLPPSIKACTSSL